MLYIIQKFKRELQKRHDIFPPTEKKEVEILPADSVCLSVCRVHGPNTEHKDIW
jgi:hypothetical protein